MIAIDISEKQLEDILFEFLADEINISAICKRGLNFLETYEQYGRRDLKVFRQLQLGGYGISDLICITKAWKENRPTLCIYVLELKCRKIKPEDFEQVLRYCGAIREIIKNKDMRCSVISKNKLNDESFEIMPILIGTGLEGCHYMNNAMPFPIYEYEFDASGIYFVERCGGWSNGAGDLDYSEINLLDNYRKHNER